jgi:hypothetical protein
MVKVRITIEIIEAEAGSLQHENVREVAAVEITQAESYRRKLNFFSLCLFRFCENFTNALKAWKAGSGVPEHYAGPIVGHEVKIHTKNEHDARKFYFHEPADY